MYVDQTKYVFKYAVAWNTFILKDCYNVEINGVRRGVLGACLLLRNNKMFIPAFICPKLSSTLQEIVEHGCQLP